MVSEILRISEKHNLKVSYEEACKIEGELKRWIKPSLPGFKGTVKTADGSYTYISDEYGEPYHSITAGAVRECYEKFLLPSRLLERATHRGSLCILDVGFGLGYNTAVPVYHLKKINNRLRIVIYSLDKEIPENVPLLPEPYGSIHRMILDGMPEFEKEGVYFRYMEGDARRTVSSLECTADAVFHDAFSPFRNPEMWTLDFLNLVVSRMHEEGIWVSYTSSLCVRKALKNLGLNVGESSPVGRRRGGTVASYDIDIKSSDYIEIQLKESPYAIPMRDETLRSSAFEILVRYFTEVIRLKAHKCG